MKNVSIIIGGILLVFNLLLHFIFLSYEPFNCILNSVIILSSVILLYLSSVIRLKDGFRYSLYCLFPVFSIVELVCGFNSLPDFYDNYWIVAIASFVILQIILLIAANHMSKNVE